MHLYRALHRDTLALLPQHALWLFGKQGSRSLVSVGCPGRSALGALALQVD